MAIMSPRENPPPFKSELIGVATQDALLQPDLKRWLLLFDRIVVDDLESCFAAASRIGKHKQADLEWLAGRKVLIERTDGSLPRIDDKYFDNEVRQALGYYHNEYDSLRNLLFDDANPDPRNDFSWSEEQAFLSRRSRGSGRDFDLLGGDWERYKPWYRNDALFKAINEQQAGMRRVEAHAIALKLRSAGADAAPVYPEPKLSERRGSNLVQVLGVIIPNVPLPDDYTDWESILSFKSDQKNKDRFTSLRRWATEVSKGDLSESELTEDLKWKLYDFKKAMEAAKIRVKSSKFEILITAAAALIGALPAILTGKNLESIFKLRKMEIELAEAENKAPGKEVAYIASAEEIFDPTE
jgi:hypothetical protein